MELTLDYFLECTANCPIIAAVKNDDWLKACKKTECDLVYILYGDICTIMDIVQTVKDMGKMAIVHVDLIQGFSSKEVCIDFLKKYTLADGIISTKPFLIKRANELGFFTIQRFFMLDYITYANVKKQVKANNPDVIELMPAGLPKVIRYLRAEVDKPVLASGLILDKEDVIGALSAGAIAISTTNQTIWYD